MVEDLWSHDPWRMTQVPPLPMARIHPQPEDKHCIKKRPGQANQTKTKAQPIHLGHNNRAGLKEDRQASKGKDRAVECIRNTIKQWIHCEGQDRHGKTSKS